VATADTNSRQAHTGPQRLGRLKWLCRRGMKELDVLLEAFIARENRALADGAWPQFEPFLATEDDQLWDWVIGRGQPEREDWRALLAALKS
jgi:antitoxin CptB